MSEPILISQDLKKSFGEIEAVKGISLQVARGEVFGLLGPNGAGKTTTISMLTGLLEPSGGQITVDGLDLKSHTNEVKAKMGLVPQEMALYMSLSARQNLMFFGRIYGLKGKELRQRVDEVLEMTGLTDRADDPVGDYSGGMKRRVNIGAGLLHKPQLLFLDEPTVGVDPQSRNAIFESVEALNRAGMSVIYTTHYMEEAQRLCQRVAIVDEGRIIAQDTPTALIRSLGGGVVLLGVSASAPEDLAERIAQVPAVKSATRSDTYPAGSTGGQLKIETQRLQEALMQTLDITNQLDVRITSLEILEPNLESVFLHLTGKKLRQ
ncbi:MAG: ATP-binding cassette domain-containing protein [Anaerolineae bacterium]|nr:ATP-binding cassette domain-containing protein [Anaerolineae bacterium]